MNTILIQHGQIETDEKKYTKENNLCELTIKLRVQTGAYNMEIIFFRKGNSQSTSKFSYVNNQKRPASFTFTLIVATYLRTLFCKGHSITITHVRLPWAIGKSHAINYVRVLYFSKVLGHISLLTTWQIRLTRARTTLSKL